MPFEEDVTKNIYNRWRDICGGLSFDEPYALNYLEDFNMKELVEIKFLIEQQIEVLNKEQK